MLVLSRNIGEVVVCTLPDGTEIRVTIVEVRGCKVRLGFDAPGSVTIHREEVADRIKKESRQ